MVDNYLYNSDYFITENDIYNISTSDDSDINIISPRKSNNCCIIL